MTEHEGEERRAINGDLAKLVMEAGAKLSAVEDAGTQMRGLKESVVVLAEAISHTVTAEEVEIQARRYRHNLIWGAALTIVIVGVLGGLLLHGQSLQRQGIRCEVLNLYEHRASNQASHDQVFNQFHVPIPPHRALPREPTELEISKACGPFLPKGY